jgi:hypothetical protein
MMGGLVTSTVFNLFVLPTFYLQVHGWLAKRPGLSAVPSATDASQQPGPH